MIELTIQEACKHSADFMYVWADEQKFLNFINPKYATVIRSKKANQNKLLTLSAQKYGKSLKDYTDAIRAQFIADYGMTPAEALVVLAQGGQVAGKYWEVGMFGVGALHTGTFAGVQVNGQSVTVNEKTGHIFAGAEDITDTSIIVYATIGKKTVAYQLFSKTVDNGKVFMSQYNKTLKKYYAQTWSDAEGAQYNARTGSQSSTSDSADIWGNILLSLETFVNWLISLFGGSTERETINAGNTLPNQKADGFVSQAGLGEMGGILLALAAGGALLAGGVGKKKTVK